jgi:hypothetical protein
MAGKRNGLLGQLQDRARRTIADNAATLSALSTPGRSPILDLVGPKALGAWRIYKEEHGAAERKSGGFAKDNRFDAERHAQTSHRMTQLLGPHLAALGGYGVEAAGLAGNLVKNARELADPQYRAPSFGAELSSTRMDLHNNAEGRRAAVEGRPVDPRRLQIAPDRTVDYEPIYDGRAPRRHTTAGR